MLTPDSICENFIGADAELVVAMESQSRSEAHASLQVDFKVLSRAHVSLQVDFKVLSGAQASLQVDFNVRSGTQASLRSTLKFDPGSAEPQIVLSRNEKLAHRQIQARIQPDYIFATSTRLVARCLPARIATASLSKGMQRDGEVLPVGGKDLPPTGNR
jgi:hypothetical protein